MNWPLILVTNDDGIDSEGLWAAVRALLPIGRVFVVAPDRQWSGAGRSFPQDVSGRVQSADRVVDGVGVTAYAVDASPALCVVHAMTELLPVQPDLVVSGINHGANVSIEVSISGTVGAALEGAAYDVPAIAASLEMEPRYHLTGCDGTDYAAAISLVRRLARRVLDSGLPEGVDVLNLNIPADADPEANWRLTRLSRRRYLEPTAPDRANGGGRPGYRSVADTAGLHPDSDVYALCVDRVASITPLSLDMTSNLRAFYPLWRTLIWQEAPATVALAQVG